MIFTILSHKNPPFNGNSAFKIKHLLWLNFEFDTYFLRAKLVLILSVNQILKNHMIIFNALFILKMKCDSFLSNQKACYISVLH